MRKIDVGTAGAWNIAGRTRLEVGKFLTDKLYVSYVYQFGATQVGTRKVNEHQGLVQYRFLPNLELQNVYGDANMGSGDMFWSHRY